MVYHLPMESGALRCTVGGMAHPPHCAPNIKMATWKKTKDR
jgi:hypothetical protein